MIMKILHLYHDIMNLYGEYANVSAVERIFTKSGIEAVVDRHSLGDNADFSEYDFIYIGSGTELNQKYVLDDFKRYKDKLQEYIESGKPILMTGNSFEMLGKTITDCSGKSFDGLGLFDFTVTEQDKKRITGDVIFECDFIPTPVVGFVNKCSEINGIENHCFTVKMGLGDCDNCNNEGVHYKNLIGTHITGPLLIKNPAVLEYVAKLILNDCDKKLCTDYLVCERRGYEITLRELTGRIQH